MKVIKTSKNNETAQLGIGAVSGTVCVHSFVPAGNSWGTDWEVCIKCDYKREQTDR